MKNFRSKLLVLTASVFLFAFVLVLSAFAATPKSGYTFNDKGQRSNIKYVLDENGVLTFSIDPSSSNAPFDKLLNMDPVTKGGSAWNKYLATYEEAVKIVVGDGITSITGFACLENLECVELAPSVTVIEHLAFENCEYLTSIYVKGNEPVEGHFDFSNITFFGTYSLDGTMAMESVALNPNLTGEIGTEVFKKNNLKEITIPAGVTKIANRAFMKTGSMELLTVLGKDTEIESLAVFQDNGTYPAIKAYAGSKAATFATENGFTFIDMETGVKIPGSRPTTIAGVSSSLKLFNPDNATAWGHLSAYYQSKSVVDTWWAFYEDTKTLEFVSATTGWNETGSIDDCDPEYGDWTLYIDQIEHIVMDNLICKIPNSAFVGYKNLKDVKIGAKVSTIDGGAFTGCSSLTTLWREGNERVEGRIDLTGITNFYDAFSGVAATEIVIPVGTEKIGFDFHESLRTIYAYKITDEIKTYAEEHFYDLVNIIDPSERYENYFYLDPTLPRCGPKATYAFDEATGTLKISGKGAIEDIMNYYGGGSKTQPWFEFRDSIKHVIIEEGITYIGRYVFCECKSIETVRLPKTMGIEILNGAFEDCASLKSVYIEGTEPIEGTFDLRTVDVLNSFIFSKDFLAANAVISPKVEKIGESVFGDNINLANIYGTPGSYAEKYASDKGFTFYDISNSTPQAITCQAPETTDGTYMTRPPLTEAPYPEDSEDEPTVTTDKVTETEPISADTDALGESGASDGGSPVSLIVIIVIAAVVIIGGAAAFLLLKKKK